VELPQWIQKKREEQSRAAAVDVRNATPSIKDFRHAVTTQRGALAVVCEIARATPEEGLLANVLDLGGLVQALDAASVSAIAVATDSVACGGVELDLAQVARATSTPVIARDLFLVPDQVYRARLHGADAVLLIASALSTSQLRALMDIAASVHMAPVVEVASEAELSAASSVGARTVVIPAFSGAGLSLSTADALLPKVPRSTTALVRGPFTSATEFQVLRSRADGIWIAGPWMRAADPAAFLGPLVEAAENG
jgi:indole-3-glycerol phosphate synthase